MIHIYIDELHWHVGKPHELGGMAIVIGMLVVATVVVVENLITHLAHVEKAERLPRLHDLPR